MLTVGFGRRHVDAEPRPREPFKTIVRAAYGDATGHVLLISAGIAVVGVIATLFLKPAKLRDSVDLAETPEPTGDKAPVAP
ncbi:hypothetical protein ACGFI3_06210 [Nonomuraea wenchangensis]|uniref:hypothetical protein n=1 Tax=Nonomuraea wenchangensis TaxID=568860 RepID=UPI003719F549